jgi:hypothetical protein
MDKEELLKLVSDINSPDSLIRNFAANIFLNIKDDETIESLYCAIKTANAYARSLFIKLIAANKKKTRKKYLLELLNDKDSAVRQEAAAAAKKSAAIFTAQDYQSMLRQSGRETRLTALEMLVENPEEMVKNDIIQLFLDRPPEKDSADLFETALKYICIHAKNDGTARDKYIAMVKEIFKTGRYGVLKSALKFAHLIAGQNIMLSIYRDNIFKHGGAADEAVVESALKFNAEEAAGFLAQFIESRSLKTELAGKCLVKLINTGEKKHIVKCLGLLAETEDQTIKFFAFNALLNIDRGRLCEILTGLITAAGDNTQRRLEYLTILSCVVIKNQANTQFILKIYKESGEPAVKAAALEILYRNNFEGLIPVEFLEDLTRSIAGAGTGAAASRLKNIAIPLLVKYLSPAHAEGVFARCAGNAADYIVFCEAYIKKNDGGPIKTHGERGLAAAANDAEYKFYKRVIKSIFEYKNDGLIAAAACTAPYRGIIDFIHDYAGALNLNRSGLYANIIKNVVVSALKNNPGAVAHFIESAGGGDLILYVGLLKETAGMEALKAIAAHFFPAGAPPVPAPLNYAVKDAVYYIVRNNITSIFDSAKWPEFKSDAFISLIAAAFLNALKEIAPAGGAAFDPGHYNTYAALYSKNNNLINFYSAISKKMALEDKFSFYNILQKAGGESALEIINELG